LEVRVIAQTFRDGDELIPGTLKLLDDIREDFTAVFNLMSNILGLGI